MELAFDQSKSSSNTKKHGIDFGEAQQLWDDPDRVEIPARDTDERRFLVIGKIADKHWSGVNVDFAIWTIDSLDKEASRLGVTRQSLIKILIAKHLERSHTS